MKTKSQLLYEQLSQKRTTLDGLLKKADATADEEKAMDDLMAEIKTMDADAIKAKVREDAEAENEAALKAMRQVQPLIPTGQPNGDGTKSVTLVQGIKKFASLKNFRNDQAGEQEAFRFGKFLLASLYNHQKSLAWCNENGIKIQQDTALDDAPSIKAANEVVNTAGGYLVPEEFDNTLIILRELYGVFRRNAKIVPMISDTKKIPRRAGGLTAFWASDGQSLTESQKSWSQVQLIAKKMYCLSRWSSEINEDAIINMADDLAGEIAYAFALKEDQTAFLGDGTSTYDGIIGFTQQFLNLSSTIANIAGLVVASGTGYGTSYGSLQLADFNKVVGQLPAYADTPNCKWYVHRGVWAGQMQRLALAAGGVTAEEVEGKRMKTFLGYPVEITQAMPLNPAVSQIIAFFGDLTLASKMGDRRKTSIALSEHAYFTTDEIGIRGTERIDINVHDIGNASATAALRVPGPVVGLITASS